LPCETDDALQQKKIFVNIFPKKVGEKRGEKHFSVQKTVQLKFQLKNFFGHPPLQL
jgi:hypothetical protein